MASIIMAISMAQYQCINGNNENNGVIIMSIINGVMISENININKYNNGNIMA